MTAQDDWITAPQSELLNAVHAFKAALPGWWYRVCECSVSCDASCGPDRTGPDAALLTDRLFDEGFDADIRQPSTMAEALADVMAQAQEAKATALALTGPDRP